MVLNWLLFSWTVISLSIILVRLLAKSMRPLELFKVRTRVCSLISITRKEGSGDHVYNEFFR